MKRNLAPTFKPYDNKQAQMILDLEQFIPDHVARMKAFMDELFETMIQNLIADNYITMEQYFLDGMKIKADANKYLFVWKKIHVALRGEIEGEGAGDPCAYSYTHPTRAGEYTAANQDELSDQLEEAAVILEEKWKP